VSPRKTAVPTSIALVCALLGGCHFEVSGFDLGFVGGGGGDGPEPTDLPQKAFVPSNVATTDVQEGASSLSGPHDIDTENLRIDGQLPPPGVVFIAEAGNDSLAVLSVRDFTVSTDVLVHGRRALVVIAVGDARLTAVMHAEAVKRSPGPGGSFTGMGHGGDGKSNGAADSGGGGAGHGAVGAGGGASDAASDGEGGLGGPSYPSSLSGGSGGGTGAGVSSTVVQPCPSGGGYSLGGAGGGALQITAKGTIDITASGGIDAGGGGGRGGCQESASAGGGGGSGGTIWLEAPTMRVLGKLAANGGAGGSGGRNAFLMSADGRDGDDATLDLTPAAGGVSRGDGSGAGGAGGVRGSVATPGQKSTNGGGGGGAVGHIRLRTRSVAPVTDPTTVVTPMQEQTVDF
jgi:hypothetical protein